ncbi:MAG: nucleotidyl transferase AbiEii/AbiGii toxin family protein [Deltaproteobacteria bacterium]|jgi:predicted nucleotidyltransferase component of viral defense system|nr:nucleotidyl transferase AbiEii/AbiGii toxin family protein [Deltaproteobacteria bacterium]
MEIVIKLSPVHHDTWRNMLDYIAKKMTASYEDKFILKGGTALMLGYNLPRISIDLDYDTLTEINISDILSYHLQNFIKTYFKINQEISTYVTIGTSPISNRYRVHTRCTDKTLKIDSTALRIDVSRRSFVKNYVNDGCYQNKIYMYNLPRTIDLKLNAITNLYFGSSREEIRDYFDAEYIFRTYIDAVSIPQITAFKNLLDSKNKTRLIEKFEAESMRGDNIHIFKEVNIKQLIDNLYRNVETAYLKIDNTITKKKVDELPAGLSSDDSPNGDPPKPRM